MYVVSCSCVLKLGIEREVTFFLKTQDHDIAIRGRLSETIHLIRELSDVQLRYAQLALHGA
jgi:hypothetical protein